MKWKARERERNNPNKWNDLNFNVFIKEKKAFSFNSRVGKFFSIILNIERFAELFAFGIWQKCKENWK